MTTYRRYTEANENEGETWTFWLQVDGNMVGLELLADRLEQLAKTPDGDMDDYPYVLEDDQIEDRDVDVLVRFGGEGYMALHTKVDGSLRLPKKFLAGDPEGAEMLLYKGGVKKFFITEAEA